MTPTTSHVQGEIQSGSSFPGEPEFLVVGKLGKPHGVHGEIMMYVYTEFPERLTPGDVVYIGEDYQPLQLTGVRTHSKGLLLSLAGYEDREIVAELRNSLVHVHTADRPKLPQGEYYHHQIVGLQVVDEDNTHLGYITGIIETGANDVFIIKADSGREVLIPAIESVVLDINLELNQVRVHLLPGLIDEG
jgi:16S rRNA processing protein RimM